MNHLISALVFSAFISTTLSAGLTTSTATITSTKTISAPVTIDTNIASTGVYTLIPSVLTVNISYIPAYIYIETFTATTKLVTSTTKIVYAGSSAPVVTPVLTPAGASSVPPPPSSAHPVSQGSVRPSGSILPSGSVRPSASVRPSGSAGATPVSVSPSVSSAAAPSSTPSSIVPPAGCPLPVWTVTQFAWFNSSHNLDCYSGVDSQKTGCIDNNNNWCDPKTNANCTLCGISLCSTGLNPQPLGYGPPDTLSITVDGVLSCADENPKGYRRHDLANGVVECGSAADQMEFYGNSVGDGSRVGHLDVHPQNTAYTCKDGRSIYYTGSVDFKFNCVHDQGGNATCTAPQFTVPILTYYFAANSDVSGDASDDGDDS